MKAFLLLLITFSALAQTPTIKVTGSIPGLSLRRALSEGLSDFGTGESCKSALLTLFQSGKKLHSEIIQKLTIPLSQMAHSDQFTHDNSLVAFYHYTDAVAVRDIGRSKKRERVNEIYDYLRRGSSYPWNSMFYVADNPIDSKNFGVFQIRVFFKPDVLVLDEYLDHKTSLRSGHENLIRDVRRRHPELKTCGEEFLYFLTVEDMGIGLIHYRWPEETYYQVVIPDVIDHLETD